MSYGDKSTDVHTFFNSFSLFNLLLNSVVQHTLITIYLKIPDLVEVYIILFVSICIIHKLSRVTEMRVVFFLL